ncbi:hypothetical protein [Spirosoma sp.]|uniref:hypothetical protein n=1 Tax=Spirosoma sp. TaxID=1899569 RepID=UPI002619EEF6|nr:hypothetical protein [Spirosoma sp.]MCX6219261.1 hypothetical protein [Spirosoma sp.]
MSIHQPILRINKSTLTFTQTAVDKPCFLLLTVAQLHAASPVTIETDAPDHFLLATDDQPTYKPRLTFVPSPEGTYVHVRYISPKWASKQAVLTVQAPYDTQTVTLEGRTAGLLAVVQKVVPVRTLPQLASGTRQSVQPFRKSWIALAVLAVASGLGYTGVKYKCQLFPSLCQSAPISKSAVEQTPALLADSATADLTVDAPSLEKRPSVEEMTTQQSVKEAAESNSLKKSVTQSNANKAPKRRKVEPAEPDQESELERELNGKPGTN